MVGSGMVFCAAFGCSTFAVVLFFLVVGSRLVLVLVVPCGGGFVFVQCWFAFGVGFGSSRWSFCVRGGFVSLVP